jgi:hypothetical protein
MKVRAPAGLAKDGSALWRKITAGYELRTDELRLLEEACRETDLIARMETALASASLMTTGSMGQPVIHPFVGELRQHRNTLRGLLAALKLPDESAGDNGGELSAKNRAAAQARWSRRGA